MGKSMFFWEYQCHKKMKLYWYLQLGLKLDILNREQITTHAMIENLLDGTLLGHKYGTIIVSLVIFVDVKVNMPKV